MFEDDGELLCGASWMKEKLAEAQMNVDFTAIYKHLGQKFMTTNSKTPIATRYGSEKWLFEKKKSRFSA